MKFRFSKGTVEKNKMGFIREKITIMVVSIASELIKVIYRSLLTH